MIFLFSVRLHERHRPTNPARLLLQSVRGPAGGRAGLRAGQGPQGQERVLLPGEGLRRVAGREGLRGGGVQRTRSGEL